MVVDREVSARGRRRGRAVVRVALARGESATCEFIAELVGFVSVAGTGTGTGTGTDSIRYAAGLPMDDFEDAMQVAAARACGARCIVTRNLRDYERSPIPAVSPQDLLSELT
ncbi:hypothetical protein [Candidatus Poriferisodalis sp.]|uniref:hypothetical protein n=1 Tax=Candidatus Poriferisodalis sp. TaxID=3101277 RepID=UPI003B0178A8